MKFLRLLLLSLLVSTAAFADITVDDVDTVTYGIFNGKWSWAHDVDRTFSIKSPFWITRLYGLRGASSSFPGALEMAVALKIGEGYDGNGGFLSIMAGYTQTAQTQTIYNNSTTAITNLQLANGVATKPLTTDFDATPYDNVLNKRTLEGSAMYAFKAGDSKVALRLEGKAGLSETNANDLSTPALSNYEGNLKTTSLTTVVGGGFAKANSFKGQFAWGIINGLLEHKSDFTVTYNDGSFNILSTNNSVTLLNTNVDAANATRLSANTVTTIKGSSVGGALTAASLPDLGSYNSTFRNYLLNLNIGQRIYNLAGVDSKLYLGLQYGQAIYDKDNNAFSTQTRSQAFNANGTLTNISDVTTVHSYAVNFQQWQPEIRLRKRWSLNEEGTVSLGIYPQYRGSYSFGDVTRTSTKTSLTVRDTNANGAYSEIGDINTSVTEFGGGDNKSQIIYTGNFRFPVAVSWKASSMFSTWMGAEFRMDHTHTWTTLTEASATTTGSDVNKTVTEVNGGAAAPATTVSDEGIRRDITKTYTVTERYQGNFGFGFSITPTPATEIVVSWALNPFLTTSAGILEGANISFIWNL